MGPLILGLVRGWSCDCSPLPDRVMRFMVRLFQGWEREGGVRDTTNW